MQAALALIVAAATAAAQNSGQTVASPATSALMACRSIADQAARLSCYDREATALHRAVENRQVVVLSPADVQKTRRSLFGFSLPKLPFFGDGADEAPEAKEINARIAAARPLGRGKWRITLEDGAVWEALGSVPIDFVPGAGSKVRIRKAALGSYLMKIDNERAVRARRIS